MDALVTALYDDLHRIASLRLRGERDNHTLQATALVHETYLRLFGEGQRRFNDRVHFLTVASRVMRQVLVDYARARGTQKRDGGLRTELTTNLEVQTRTGIEQLDLLELDRALDALAREDKSLEQVIEMRYFGGMTAEETAESLGYSVHVVRHHLRLAQAWLRRELSREGG